MGKKICTAVALKAAAKWADNQSKSLQVPDNSNHLVDLALTGTVESTEIRFEINGRLFVGNGCNVKTTTKPDSLQLLAAVIDLLPKTKLEGFRSQLDESREITFTDDAMIVAESIVNSLSTKSTSPRVGAVKFVCFQ